MNPAIRAIEKRRWQERHRRVCRPWLSAPGDFLIVDWGEVGTVVTAAGQRKLYCFCAVLGWSRWRYVLFFTYSEEVVGGDSATAPDPRHVSGHAAQPLEAED